jgi:hypothetical protein
MMIYRPRSLEEIKADLVVAHRAKDWEAAKLLSQEKYRAQKKKHCCDCGTRILSGTRCHMHARTHRYYARSLPRH